MKLLEQYSECKPLNIKIYTLLGDKSQEEIRGGMRRPLVNTNYKTHPHN